MLKEEQTQSQLAAKHGVHPNQLRQWKDLALKGLPRLFEPGQDLAAQAVGYESKVNELYAEIGRLTTQVGWLKKNLVSRLTRSERLALLERAAPELSVSQQAELLSLSRSGLYYKPVAPSATEIALKHRIDEIYTAWPFYWARKLTAQLRRKGTVINRKAVQNHMREMGHAGITPGPNLSRRAQGQRVFPYLLRGVVIARPNQVWGIDITYIRLLGGWLYLVAVIDWRARYILSYHVPGFRISIYYGRSRFRRQRRWQIFVQSSLGWASRSMCFN